MGNTLQSFTEQCAVVNVPSPNGPVPQTQCCYVRDWVVEGFAKWNGRSKDVMTIQGTYGSGTVLLMMNIRNNQLNTSIYNIILVFVLIIIIVLMFIAMNGLFKKYLFRPLNTLYVSFSRAYPALTRETDAMTVTRILETKLNPNPSVDPLNEMDLLVGAMESMDGTSIKAVVAKTA